MVYPILIFTLPLLLGFLLDRALGDPMRLGHPIVFFGRLIGLGEKHLNHGTSRRLKGFLYNGSLVCFTFLLPLLTFAFLLIGAAINYYLGDLYFGHFLLLTIALPSTICIFYMLSGKTLVTEVKGVFSALSVSLEAGRKQVGRIVGRDTGALSAQEIRTAALETLAENLSDGVVGPMLSWSFFGTPGILTYKTSAPTQVTPRQHWHSSSAVASAGLTTTSAKSSTSPISVRSSVS